MFTCDYPEARIVYSRYGPLLEQTGTCGAFAVVKYSGSSAKYSWTGYRCAEHSKQMSPNVVVEQLA